MHTKIKNSSITIFMENVDTLDCAVFDINHGVVGHSWCVDVGVVGKVDDNFLIYDFGKLKSKVKIMCKNTLDHRLIVPTHPWVRLKSDGWFMTAKAGKWQYSCPPDAVVQLSEKHIDEEVVSCYLSAELQKELGDDLKLVVSLRSVVSPHGVQFNYTHGLPTHEGCCQRLLHGHLGMVQVFSDDDRGARSDEMEDFLANTVLSRNVHFVNSNHVEKKTDTKVVVTYTSTEGTFRATLPRAHTFILPQMEASVETIAFYLASLLHATYDDLPPLELLCWEGTNKGASFSSAENPLD